MTMQKPMRSSACVVLMPELAGECPRSTLPPALARRSELAASVPTAIVSRSLCWNNLIGAYQSDDELWRWSGAWDM